MTNKIVKSDTDYIEIASKAGLSGKAAKVYVALLEYKNPLAPKNIIIKTNLHRQYVYDALHELEHLGLVSPVGQDRAVKYVATTPNKLLQDAEKKRLDTLDSVQKLLELYNKTPAGLIEITSGKLAVRESEWRILEESPDNAYLDIIGGAGTAFLDLMGDELEAQDKLRQDKKIFIRYITTRGDTTYLNKYRHGDIPLYEVRYLENTNDAINICIRPSSVSFSIYEPEIMILRVKSEAAAASQRALFEILWSVAAKA
jgi:predicted transcriptional regulator